MRTRSTRQYRDTPVDVKHLLCALWIATLVVFAYVDIFGFLRADVLKAALDGKAATTDFTINQVFLTLTLIYILLPTLMVVLSLVLQPRANRILNIAASILYMISIAVSCFGETWAYYLIGSVIEVMLLAMIARTAWSWPPPRTEPPPSQAEAGAPLDDSQIPASHR